MNQEEQFQYVVSKQDYNELKNSKLKCQQLTELLSEAQTAYSEDKESYLNKIEVLEQELRSYKVSVRQYVDREIKQIDSLLKMLNQYQSSHEGSSLNLGSIEKIRSQCEKLSQQFTISLKDLQIINFQVITVIRNLVSDSLSLHEKLQHYKDLFTNNEQEKDQLYTKIRTQTEKNVILEKQKDRLIKGQQKLKYQIQMLIQSVKQKQEVNLSLEIELHNQKSRLNEELFRVREDNIVRQKKMKETYDTTVKDYKDQLTMKQNDSQLIKRYLTEEIQSLKLKQQAMADQLQIKTLQLKHLEVALQQHKQQNQSTRQTLKELQMEHEKKELQNQRINEEYERKMKSRQVEFVWKQKQAMLQIENMESRLQRQVAVSGKLENDLQKMRDNQQLLQQEISQHKLMQSKLRNQLQQFAVIIQTQRQAANEKISKLENELTEKKMMIQYMEMTEVEYGETVNQQKREIKELRGNLQNAELSLKELETKLRIKAEQLQAVESDANRNNKSLLIEIQHLKKALAASDSQQKNLQETASSLNQELTKHKQLYQQSAQKLTRQNEQILIQLKITVDDLDKKKKQLQELTKILNEVKLAKNKVENQYCQLVQMREREEKGYHEQLAQFENQIFMLRSALGEKQQMQVSLMKQVDSLRAQAKNSHSIQQSSNLLKMDLQALQNDVQLLKKQKSLIKKQQQSLAEQLSQSRIQNKFLNEELNSIKIYIDQLQQNLQKLTEQKIALRNEMNLFKQEAEFCKKENIEQLQIIDHLERELQSAKKQLKTVSQSIDPVSIVKRSSLSKGEKSYYVKEMVLEYKNEMQRNLENIGALSYEEIKELIVSELKELGNFVKKLQKDF